MKNKKRRLFTLLLSLFLAGSGMMFSVDNVNADAGQGGSTWASSTASGSPCYDYCDIGSIPDVDNGKGQWAASVYIMRVMYKEKPGDAPIQIGRTKVVHALNSYAEKNLQGNRGAYIQLAKKYASDHNADYVSDGVLQELARGIESEDNFVSRNYANPSKDKVKKLLLNGFGLRAADLQLPNDNNRGRGDRNKPDSYGYRIVIEKANTWWKQGSFMLATKREWIGHPKSIYSNKVCSNEGNAQKDLYLPYDDWGLSKGSSNVHNGLCNTNLYRSDFSSGQGYNILWFNTEQFKPKGNFQVDAACQRCDSQDAQNKALIVQDTPDWGAILETKNYPNEDPYKRVKNYFSKGNGIVCREEIYTHFPNQNNIIAVEPGRYFAVNPSGDEKKSVISSGIPNFRPVKVTKIRQCKGADANKLNNYAKNAEGKFKKEMGTVWFKYTENYSGSHYSNDGYQKMRGYGQTYSSGVSGDMLTMTTSMNYTLPKDYYQYIYKASGLSIRQATTTQKNSGQYLNVGIPNLPVSIYNTSKDVAKVQFAYDLPKDDGHKLGTAYTEKNDYLKLGDTKNIYKEGKEGNLRNSACAKMYGYNQGLYRECVKHRTSNSVGLRGSGTGYSSCFGKLDKNADGSIPEGYICIVKNNDCTTEEDANKLGRSWNPEDKSCCPVGKVYNPSTKKCENTPDKKKCIVDESTNPITYYDSKGNKTDLNGYKADCPGENICEIKNGKYYKDGVEITREQYIKDCDPNTITCPPGYKSCDGVCIDENEICPPTDKCDDDCEYGCCPSGECAPMPKVDGHIVCPYPGSLNIIYRPVDLKYTFPGQAGTDAGKSRDTGKNWCEYNTTTKKFNCKSNNNVVKYYVNNKNTEVYSGNPLYEVKLDSKAISSIREYNRNQKSQGGYDDFTLKCDSDGKKCISQFLRGRTSASVTLENSSLCKSTNKSDFNKCDDSKKGSR